MNKKFVISCIDYRFPDDVYTFLDKSNHIFYQASTAGASLPLSYFSCAHHRTAEFKSLTNILKDSICTNIEISLMLSPLKEIIIINHQDCGAFKYFLPHSGYPQHLGDNNPKELEIQLASLQCARNHLLHKYPVFLHHVHLQIIDINGTLGQYNDKTKLWEILFHGRGTNPKGLFYKTK